MYTKYFWKISLHFYPPNERSKKLLLWSYKKQRQRIDQISNCNEPYAYPKMMGV